MPQRPNDDLEDMLSQLASSHQETAEQLETLMSAPVAETGGEQPVAAVELPGEVVGPSPEDALALAAQAEAPSVNAGKSEEEIMAALASEPVEGDVAVVPSQEQSIEPTEPAAQEWVEPAAPAGAQSRRRHAAPPKSKSSSTAAMGFFIPIIFLFGVLTLIPAVLGVLIMMGADVPLSGREDSKTMAVVMLACWPVSLGLIAGGIWYLVQYNSARRKAAEEKPRQVRGKAL